MAVTQTPSTFGSLTFGGVNSATYGIYISGSAVFNAPERVVELVAVPGRNGAVAIDQRRFENIAVEYPAGTFGADKEEFRTNLASFRNALMAKRGYQRLADSYHPEEFRQAIMIDPFEVDPVRFLEAGEFTIKFNCKPQRWLTSGETAVVVANNGTLTNPTLFESEPLLAVKGYGTIAFNGYTVEIENRPIGEILLHEATRNSRVDFLYSGDTPMLNLNDVITVEGVTDWFIVENADTISVSDSNASCYSMVMRSGNNYVVQTTYPAFNFAYAFPSSTTISNTTTITGTDKDGNAYTATYQHNVKGETDEYGEYLANVYVSGTKSITGNINIRNTPDTSPLIGEIIGDSSKYATGMYLYIDCEIGEAYVINNAGKVISVNNNVYLDAELPKLASGSNTFIYSNTITELKVTPRWWQL